MTERVEQVAANVTAKGGRRAQQQPPTQQPPAADPFGEACKTVVRELAAAIALAG